MHTDSYISTCPYLGEGMDLYQGGLMPKPSRKELIAIVLVLAAFSNLGRRKALCITPESRHQSS